MAVCCSNGNKQDEPGYEEEAGSSVGRLDESTNNAKKTSAVTSVERFSDGSSVIKVIDSSALKRILTIT